MSAHRPCTYIMHTHMSYCPHSFPYIDIHVLNIPTTYLLNSTISDTGTRGAPTCRPMASSLMSTTALPSVSHSLNNARTWLSKAGPALTFCVCVCVREAVWHAYVHGVCTWSNANVLRARLCMCVCVNGAVRHVCVHDVCTWSVR